MSEIKQLGCWQLYFIDVIGFPLEEGNEEKKERNQTKVTVLYRMVKAQ